MKKLFGLYAIILAFAGSNTFATSWTEITQCGYQINQAGNYRVANDLVCNQPPYIGIMIVNVNSGRVRLDLDDYVIRSTQNFQGIGIYVHRARNVDIEADRDATIKGFQTGIQLWDQNRDVEIDGDHMTLKGNRTAVLLRNSRDVKVKELKFQSNLTDMSVLNMQDFEMFRMNR